MLYYKSPASSSSLFTASWTVNEVSVASQAAFQSAPSDNSCSFLIPAVEREKLIHCRQSCYSQRHCSQLARSTCTVRYSWSFLYMYIIVSNVSAQWWLFGRSVTDLGLHRQTDSSSQRPVFPGGHPSKYSPGGRCCFLSVRRLWSNSNLHNFPHCPSAASSRWLR